ncbi:MetQ/NlpA family ABC transporter substrate-binding protein [Endozoicomonas elysicola]|uniref:Lipoprotein n=1 Tax=Endozoicomonas elysicola TaxID=305900 RepID=A0A081KDV8_9GAMM|nr:MetQ/NlpA family ABC transporter substrate-binding protein [Endozoicomonas elysicola]KEI72334.1 DL-methionine transporter substrate-binding subunit [Endozoicomonas elysicola]
MTFNILKTVKILASSAVLASAALLVGCGQSDDPNGPLKVGVMAGPEADVMKVAVDIAKKDHNVDVELIEFSDYVSPNVALSDGSIDANAFQHRPYLDSMVRDRGFKLVAVGNTFVYPIAAYSKKLKDISELKDGAKIAIPNDPSNEGRTLILLHQRGFIKLNDVNNLEATPADIVENPRNFQFIELDAAQLPRSLDDVDMAFINNTYAVPAGYIPTRDALLVEDKDSPYVNIIVTREDNKEDPRVVALVKSYQTDTVEAKAAELFKGSSVAGWK